MAYPDQQQDPFWGRLAPPRLVQRWKMLDFPCIARRQESDQDFGFELTLDADSLAPGQSGSGTISIWAEEAHPTISAGRRFEVKEGRRAVGNGVIDCE